MDHGLKHREIVPALAAAGPAPADSGSGVRLLLHYLLGLGIGLLLWVKQAGLDLLRKTALAAAAEHAVLEPRQLGRQVFDAGGHLLQLAALGLQLEGLELYRPGKGPDGPVLRLFHGHVHCLFFLYVKILKDNGLYNFPNDFLSPDAYT